MMKKITLVGIALHFFLIGAISAQNEFGAVGSFWRYTYEAHDGNGTGWEIIAIEKDTMINGLLHKVLRRTFFHEQLLPPLATNQGSETIGVMRIANDSVFIDNTLRLDFNMELTDSLLLTNLPAGIDLQLAVDSISSVLLAGENHQIWYGQKICLNGASPGPYENFTIVEKVGQIEQGYLLWNTDGCAIGGGINSFVCYQNGDFTYPPSASCERLTLTSTEIPSQPKPLLVYPNPAQNLLHIKSQGRSMGEISILSLTGQRLLRTRNQATINIEFLKKGTYLLQIQMDQQLITSRFLKL